MFGCVYILLMTTGFTTDALHSKENSQPLSIPQLRSNARAKYAQLKVTKLIGMLTPVCK